MSDIWDNPELYAKKCQRCNDTGKIVVPLTTTGSVHVAPYAICPDCAEEAIKKLKDEIGATKAENDKLKAILLRKGYRESCDIPACNCGDGSWRHGGHAEERLHEISDEVWENGVTTLNSIKKLKADLERCRGALKATITNVDWARAALSVNHVDHATYEINEAFRKAKQVLEGEG